MGNLINIILGLISFIAGLFISKKISEADKLKMQVKQFEENQKTQNEILERNISSINTSTSNKRLYLKNKRTSK